MTTALILSKASQRIIAEQAEKDAQREHAKARKSLWWSLGGFAASIAVAAVFPPAALAGVLSIVGATVGIVAGAYATGHYANEKMLRDVKNESSKEGFADKIKNRAARLGNLFRVSDKVSDRSLYTALGLAAVAWLVPPVAPVAWGLYSLAIYTMGISTLVRATTRDSARSSDSINLMTHELAARDTLAATIKPSNENQPPAPGLAQSPSPAKEFDKVVHGPAAPEAAVPAPVNRPPAPKP